ncbi:MAG: carbon-nitrogen hydrolase family protein [Sphingomonadales bacterium]|nr:carbon-nitrogen hydrolase family protein [Sphingomonadales bacterium]
MKIAIHQMCSGINPQDNVAAMQSAIADASKSGAICYFAPEMSGLLDRDRLRAKILITPENESRIIAAISDAARASAIWVHLGSIAVQSDREPGKFANRSLIIDPSGQVRARYDKMHLFDVDLQSGETWRESSAYIAGQEAVLVDMPLGQMGLSICYDLRFPELYSRLARAGADIFAVPAAFTRPTGQAHWHTLLRARAIENAAFIVAAAQSGQHEDGRETYGHSLVIDPWGEILLDMGEAVGIGYAEIDRSRIDTVRAQIPVHLNRCDISGKVNRC